MNYVYSIKRLFNPGGAVLFFSNHSRAVTAAKDILTQTLGAPEFDIKTVGDSTTYVCVKGRMDNIVIRKNIVN